MTAPPHRNYYPDTFTEGETFTAFSHTEACRIVGHVVETSCGNPGTTTAVTPI
jgi:hypothetical protein